MVTYQICVFWNAMDESMADEALLPSSFGDFY